MAAHEGLNEHDLVEIRQALEKLTLTGAISAMEQVLVSLGYVRLEANMLRKKEYHPAMNKVKLETRAFELCSGKYTSLPELARAMGIHPSLVYRVRQGKRKINATFIIGAIKAFPGHKLDDLFYFTAEGASDDCRQQE